MLLPQGVMYEIDTRIPHVLHIVYIVSHLLCAMLALGSATHNTLNSMFVTPISACEGHAIVTHRGVGWWSALHIIPMWFSMQISLDLIPMNIHKQRYKRANLSTRDRPCPLQAMCFLFMPTTGQVVITSITGLISSLWRWMWIWGAQGYVLYRALIISCLVWPFLEEKKDVTACTAGTVCTLSLAWHLTVKF